MAPSLVYFQSVIPVLCLLGCRVVRSAAEADGRHLCWYITIVEVVWKWSWGVETIGFRTLFMAVSMEQNSNSNTANKPRWYLMQRDRFAESLLGRTGSEKRQQWDCERPRKMD